MTDRDQLDPNSHDRYGHDRYEEWGAAYVLGALSPAERHEYETHLSGCPQCSAAVADLAAMPGLLGALPTADAFAMLETDGSGPVAQSVHEPVPANILSGLTARVRRRRRARAWTAGIATIAAAAAITAAIVLPTTMNAPAQPTVSATLSPANPAAPGPITASVQLTSVKWGTKIAVSCSYSSNATTPAYNTKAGRYGLYVTGADGTTTQVSSWRAWPGSTVNAAASTATQESDIVRIELRSLDTGAILLRRTLN